MLGAQEIEKRFTYHPPQGNRPMVVRRWAKDFAELLDELVVDGREKSLALTHLEQAVMWANAGIARENASKAQSNGSGNPASS